MSGVINMVANYLAVFVGGVLYEKESFEFYLINAGYYVATLSPVGALIAI